MNSWSPLEHNIFRQLKALPPKPDHYYGVAVSGGPDSVWLLHCLQKLKYALKIKLIVLHVHHGTHENREFRDRAEVFVTELAGAYNLPIQILKNTNAALLNEGEFRDLRRSFFKSWQEQDEMNVGVFLGHHSDDLLETRIMRLLRGTGAQGLESMALSTTDDGFTIIRPLLEMKKVEIFEDLKNHNQKFLVDPASEDLRNWIRQQWLPQLETKLPGSVAALARSLQNLSEQVADSILKPENFIPEIKKNDYFAFTGNGQRQWIAACLKWHQILDYTRGQIQEVQKRLDKKENEHIFEIAGLRWVVDAKNITSHL